MVKTLKLETKTKMQFSKDVLVAGIDGDVLVYRSAFAAQHALHTLLADDGTVIKQSQKKRELQELAKLSPATTTILTETILRDESVVKQSLLSVYKTILKNTNADKGIVYISGDSNFRESVAKTAPYKGHRTVGKPEYYDYAKELIYENFEVVTSDFCEADDLLSIALTSEYKRARQLRDKSQCKFICCTIDKDLTTVPGWHYNISTKVLKWINNLDASRFFYTQLLMGDNADNIKGIPGVGLKGATEALKNCTSVNQLEQVTIAKYKDYFGSIEWLDAFLENGRLLHMQRYEGELWTPLNTNITLE